MLLRVPFLKAEGLGLRKVSQCSRAVISIVSPKLAGRTIMWSRWPRRWTGWETSQPSSARISMSPAYTALRKAETIGRPVGSTDWLAMMEDITGLKLAAAKRGRKPVEGVK